MSKVLIIDDDQAMRKFLSIGLAPLGCKIIEAKNGVEGLSLLSQETPDLIICDYHMPEMNGLRTIQLIRNEDSMRDIPVIIITCDNERKTIAEFMKLGVTSYFCKPVELNKLKVKIQEIISLRKAKAPEEVLSSKSINRKIGKPSVVICEPNQMLADKLVNALSKDYEATVVSDGAACLNAIIINQPEALLLDPDLKFVPGLVIAQRVKSIQKLQSIKVIMFASVRNREEIDKISNCIDKVIEKPYTTPEVLEALNEVLSNCNFRVFEGEKQTLLKMSESALRWASENTEQAHAFFERLMLQMFEGGKTFLVIDVTQAKDDQSKFSSLLIELIEKAVKREMTIKVITDSEELRKSIKAKTYKNVLAVLPEPASTLPV